MPSSVLSPSASGAIAEEAGGCRLLDVGLLMAALEVVGGLHWEVTSEARLFKEALTPCMARLARSGSDKEGEASLEGLAEAGLTADRVAVLAILLSVVEVVGLGMSFKERVEANRSARAASTFDGSLRASTS